jgi:hypothetical protein
MKGGRLLAALAVTASAQFHYFDADHIALDLDDVHITQLQNQYTSIEILLPDASQDLWMTAFVQSLVGDFVADAISDSAKVHSIDQVTGVSSDAFAGKDGDGQIDMTQALYVFNQYCDDHKVRPTNLDWSSPTHLVAPSSPRKRVAAHRNLHGRFSQQIIC